MPTTPTRKRLFRTKLKKRDKLPTVTWIYHQCSILCRFAFGVRWLLQAGLLWCTFTRVYDRVRQPIRICDVVSRWGPNQITFHVNLRYFSNFSVLMFVYIVGVSMWRENFPVQQKEWILSYLIYYILLNK